jgi:hypothetical protein
MRVNAYMYFIAGKLFNKIVEGGYPGICERLRTEGRRGITSCVGGPVAAQDQAQDRMSLERTRGSQERPEPLDGTVAASADFECRCRLGLSAKRSPGKGPSCASARRPHYFSGDELRDFSDSAALIDLMDLVITVDTSVAHLAGRWASRSGYCCRSIPIGDGCSIGRTAPGIRAPGCSGNNRSRIRPGSSSG